MGLTREQLLKKLNIIKDGPDLEALTTKAMVEREEQYWRDNEGSSPHGNPWHTSFHASAFPGSEADYGCTQLYSLMDIPIVDHFSPKLSGQAAVGNAVEEFTIRAWRQAGLLLGEQEKFEDPELWLTGSADAILKVPGYNHVFPVDVKSKDHDVIKAMRIGARSYDEKHFMQLQAYIYLCRKFHDYDRWAGFKEACGGMIYYASRQDPTFVKQFWIDADWDVIGRGVQNLEKFKQLFIEDKIPQRPDKQKWTLEPCKWCSYKRECMKKDFKNLDTKLSESEGIRFAESVRVGYNAQEKRKEVLKRWLPEHTMM